VAILDFGNFSTQVSQEKRRQRPLYFLGDLDNLDAFKRLGHVQFILPGVGSILAEIAATFALLLLCYRLTKLTRKIPSS